MQYRRLFVRFVYRLAYALLYLVLAALLLVTPGDAIERSRRNDQGYNIWIVAISYLVTVVIVCFVYLMRLYINKTALAAIPRSYVPIGKGDFNEDMYRTVAAGLDRSAAIALEARPGQRDGQQIEHAGWASPSWSDMPSLEYASVLLELPNLLEAKALALAAASPAARPRLLLRQPTMTMRSYLDRLLDLGVVAADEHLSDFLARYEEARFAKQPLSNARFRQLTHLFAEILRQMRPPGPEALGSPSGSLSTRASSRRFRSSVAASLSGSGGIEPEGD